MADPEMIKKWALVESQLRSALGLARPLLSDGDARQTSEFLDHNELGLALEGLVSSLAMRRWLQVFAVSAVVFSISIYAFNLADEIGRLKYLVFAGVAGVALAATLATLDGIAHDRSPKWTWLRPAAKRIIDDDQDD